MKIINYLAAAILLTTACNHAGKKAGTSPEKEDTVAALNIGDFMDIAIDSIGKEVWVKGTVSHVCSHSGRRCFLVDSLADKSVRVEAKGDINGFNRELTGMDITLRGIVKEKRLTSDYLNDWEIKVKAEEDAEEGGEHCAAELQNIESMRQWMKEHHKDYYSVIYIDGLEYTINYTSGQEQ